MDYQAYGMLLNVPWATPMAGVVELTSRCAQRCPKCTSWKAPTQDLPIEVFGRLVDEIDQIPSMQSLRLTGGDALLYPEIKTALDAVPSHLFVTLSTSLVKAPDKALEHILVTVVDQLRVSLDSLDDEQSKEYRGSPGGFPSKVMQNIVALGHPNTYIYCTVDQHNIDVPRKIAKWLPA